MDQESSRRWSTFDVELDPGSPAMGWRCPTFTFDAAGVVAPGLDVVGSAVRIRLTTSAGEWVGHFAGGAVAGPSQVLSTPTPDRCCVISEGRAYVVEAESSPPRAEVVMEDVRTTASSESPPLLVLANWTEAVGIGAEGRRWRTERLAIDDLAILSVDPTGVVCECDNPDVGGVRRIVLDPSTGHQISGPRLPDVFR